ncbi:helix-turn-helix domain-containing protein [Methylobacterium indicum]|uniref:helix-turn-helix transcriptional regulator n=1 Tax=Methylobacterium indicum TaxID=1775910 RepID=UPI0009EC316A
MIQQGTDDIIGNLDRRLAIAEVAAQVGLSEFHVMRLFKAETGMTVHQYVVHRRLEAARRAPARGVPPAEAATRYGFDERGHFTGHFRPSEPCRGVTRMPAGSGGPQPTATGCLTTEGVRIVTNSSPAVG